ncbi:hypothetical protein [Paenibacillus tepidiphilus]|uniref:hypothetical protein n=1 Tax=Paenibacillus tepidiphilus TaxID=2608683 RepID=UPI0012394B5A|nr:hypothetical protein [Paenibacillus tepidiphilus]
MKKIIGLLITILLLAISGCETNRFNNIMEKIEFNQVIGLYTINVNHSEDNVPSVLLFGKTLNLTEDMINELNELNTSITLLNENKDEIIFDSDDIEWGLSDPKLHKGGFSLRLTSNNILINNELVFDKIIIVANKKIIKRDINPIYLQFYSGEKNGISIMESPIAPKDKVILGKEYSYSYKVLDSNHAITNFNRAELIYPDEVRKFIEIINVNVIPDMYTEEQIKKEYKGRVDEKKIKGLKVYEIQCTYSVKKEGIIVFQPEIKLFFNKYEQSLAPFEPISFFNFVEAQ